MRPIPETIKPVKRLNIRVYGIVQGVGFRPFVKNLAAELGVSGTVCNKGPYVEIIAESGEQVLAAFLHCLKTRAPARAQIVGIDTFEEPVVHLDSFEILESGSDEGEIFISPDIAICPDCARELFEKGGRRYLHPFINCTACGPRLTILDGMPYDRVRTSMAAFPMCPQCEREYSDTRDRRFHAQPVCCPHCGPRLYTLDGSGTDGGVIVQARRVIREGGVAAVKGIGGFHLCCDARSDAAVKLLRTRKHRPAKPFAVMARDLAAAERECIVGAAEAELLGGPVKPIVLLDRRPEGKISGEVAPGNPKLGVMLPYAPVQMLLFDYPDGENFTDCLVMTSGNISGSPICIDDMQAREELTGLCDIIVSNDRAIRLRADDSVVGMSQGKPYMIRRSRGYAPLPLRAYKPSSRAILAVGGELKNTFCLVRGDKLYLSPYVGDLTDVRGVEALGGAVKRMSRLLRMEPEAVACDLHPGYRSTAFAESLGLPVLPVQHHFAHIASCMAENELDGEVIGVAFDGTGWGGDGSIWGGEFLRASYAGFDRIGSIAPFTLAGGDRAATEAFRPAIALLLRAFGGDTEKARRAALELGLCGERELAAVLGMLKANLNCMPTSSAGRLFDAVSALLGIRNVSTFEGEAAMALEFAAAADGESPIVPSVRDGKPFEIETADVIQYIVRRRLAGGDAGRLAADFHAAAASMVEAGCVKSREMTGLSRVCLSGGCFQNLRLLALCESRLAAAGFEVFVHTQVPPNDGGIALGQAAVALEYFAKN